MKIIELFKPKSKDLKDYISLKGNPCNMATPRPEIKLPTFYAKKAVEFNFTQNFLTSSPKSVIY